MTTAIVVFFIAFALFVAVRRGVFSRFTGSGNAIPLLPFTAPGDQPPRASEWEKQLLADALDDHRRDKAKASLFAELRAISDPGPSASPASSAKPANPFE
ncbi:hypothetical protein [Allorhodopirellula heiligendammensis]|uniref:Uncharacterized protein n=1 Tax=Allorhodopirellula heiligendammensis TaxID=2714739 RepID=A0A5C6C7R6_9BACT|nr:hypothetical protein [Allorhodopirellula heiligendammensis]TWU19541.1 hypothetical protein Poly21_17150 [Allorhodopirellula heiligendammensis]